MVTRDTGRSEQFNLQNVSWVSLSPASQRRGQDTERAGDTRARCTSSCKQPLLLPPRAPRSPLQKCPSWPHVVLVLVLVLPDEI